jgi:hypothetical protein
MALLDKLGSASATPDTAILARWADVCSLVDARANLCAAWLRLPKVLHTALCYVGNDVQSIKGGDGVIMSTHPPIFFTVWLRLLQILRVVYAVNILGMPCGPEVFMTSLCRNVVTHAKRPWGHLRRVAQAAKGTFTSAT